MSAICEISKFDFEFPHFSIGICLTSAKSAIKRGTEITLIALFKTNVLLAKHSMYFKGIGDYQLAGRLTDMLAAVTEKMESLRAVNQGRLPFAMHPDGSPFFARESDHANFSDLFYSKGLFAASRILNRPDLETEAEKLFLFVLNEIEQGLFHTDQQCFDPKNKVSYIPGKFPQGPRMIALGGIADWIEAKPNE